MTLFFIILSQITVIFLSILFYFLTFNLFDLLAINIKLLILYFIFVAFFHIFEKLNIIFEDYIKNKKNLKFIKFFLFLNLVIFGFNFFYFYF